MEGLEISEVLFSKVKKESYSHRWDSNYFLKEFLFSSLANIKTDLIENLFTIKSGTTPKNRNDALKEGVILLKTNDIRNNILKDKGDSFFYVNEATNLKMSSTQLEPNDVLINIVGATTEVIGRVSYVSDAFPKANITQAMSLMRVKQNKISSHYLFCFLLSKYGNMQVRRFSRPTGQFNMNHSELGGFEIPLLSLKFQQELKNIIQNNHLIGVKSQKLHTQAEQILLEEIDLQDFKPSNSPPLEGWQSETDGAVSVNIKSFKDSFGTSGRLDAEYYQKKYERIENAIKSYSNGFETLDAFIDDFSTGYPYKSNSYIKEGGVPLIRINNIKKGFLDLSNAIEVPKSDLELSVKDIAYENDILISMSGTIGNSCKVPKGVKAVVNQRIMKITPKNFNFEVLPLVINSLIGQLQLNRIGTGGVQTNISSTDIRKIFIPKIKESKQQQIADLIEQSFALKKQSEHLLELAKQSVEIAIEKDETVALRYIKQMKLKS